LTSGLLLDLYELTMAQSYLDEGMEGAATFSLFVRHLPPGRGYLVAAGLEDALRYLESFGFTSADIHYLESTGLFRPDLLDRLSRIRFTGSVRAMPEGTACLADEPLLEVTAPIIEAQLVETMLINEQQLQTGGRRLVDFSLRRTHGGEAGLKVARASYLGGFDATSNVLAGERYGIPIAGTMAHSYVEAFEEEIDAFRAYARAYPETAVLLLDTYDTIEGAHRAAQVGQELAAQGQQLLGVRLDSGDLGALSGQVRRILDDAGLGQTTIFASGALDEYAIEALAGEAAPIDGFGVGTRLGVSADIPHLDVAYKLVAYDGRPTLKLSAEKATWPGPKQVWRQPARQGWTDWLGLATEEGPAGSRPLLAGVMAGGRRLAPPEPLDTVRARCREELAALPPEALRLRDAPAPMVQPTDALVALNFFLSHPATAHGGASMTQQLGRSPIKLDAHDALIVVDPQNDFCPGGTLAVPHGDEVFDVINATIPRFRHVLATQDWHPPEHKYFQAFGGPWPYHCLQGTPGAAFHPKLNAAAIQETVQKGTDPELDGYSGFAGTDLAERLRRRGIRRVFVGGLATDYCVKATAIEALGNAFETYVLTDAIRPVELQPGDGERALQAMAEAGVHLITSQELAAEN
jgi:nicotinate phosphoribosyltransferase